MVRKTFPIVLLLLLAYGCSAPSSRPDPVPVTAHPSTVADVPTNALKNAHAHTWTKLPKEPSTFISDKGDTLRTGIPGARLLTHFQNATGRDWLVLSGLSTTSERSGTSLYVLSPGDSTAAQAVQHPWHMPGRLMDPTDTKIYYDAQAFAGEVLRDTMGVIWYERYVMPDGTWRLNTTLLDLSSSVPDTLVLFGHSRKTTTIGLAFRGRCDLLDTVEQHLQH